MKGAIIALSVSSIWRLFFCKKTFSTVSISLTNLDNTLSWALFVYHTCFPDNNRQ